MESLHCKRCGAYLVEADATKLQIGTIIITGRVTLQCPRCGQWRRWQAPTTHDSDARGILKPDTTT